jgi:hypothetical protein
MGFSAFSLLLPLFVTVQEFEIKVPQLLKSISSCLKSYPEQVITTPNVISAKSGAVFAD